MVGSGEGEIQLINNSGRECSVYGAPNVVLKSSDGEILNPEPGTDENQEAPLITVASGNVATADLTYESGPVSEGGSQDGITCGKDAASAEVSNQDAASAEVSNQDAASAEVSNQDATWKAEIRANEAGDADAVGSGLIVCGPKTTVGPFQQPDAAPAPAATPVPATARARTAASARTWPTASARARATAQPTVQAPAR